MSGSRGLICSKTPARAILATPTRVIFIEALCDAKCLLFSYLIVLYTTDFSYKKTSIKRRFVMNEDQAILAELNNILSRVTGKDRLRVIHFFLAVLNVRDLPKDIYFNVVYAAYGKLRLNVPDDPLLSPKIRTFAFGFSFFDVAEVEHLRETIFELLPDEVKALRVYLREKFQTDVHSINTDMDFPDAIRAQFCLTEVSNADYFDEIRMIRKENTSTESVLNAVVEYFKSLSDHPVTDVKKLGNGMVNIYWEKGRLLVTVSSGRRGDILVSIS